MLLYCIAAPARRAQATSLVRRQNLISKSHSGTLARPFNSRSPVQQTVILDSSEFPQNAGTAADLSSERPHAQLTAKASRASAVRNKLTIRFKLNPDSAALSGRFSLGPLPGLKAWAVLFSAAADKNVQTAGGAACSFRGRCSQRPEIERFKRLPGARALQVTPLQSA